MLSDMTVPGHEESSVKDRSHGKPLKNRDIWTETWIIEGSCHENS